MGRFKPRTELYGNTTIVYGMEREVLLKGPLVSIDSMFDFNVDGQKFSIGASDMMDVLEDGTVELYNAWRVE